MKTVPLREEKRAYAVELRIPSKAEWVGVARLAIAGVANRLSFSIEDIEDLKLVVAEACTNAIANASEDDKIHITCEIHPIKIVVAVANRSPGAAKRLTVSQPAGDVRTAGLGLFLIRSLMDEVTEEIDQQGVAWLVMTKFFGAT